MEEASFDAAEVSLSVKFQRERGVVTHAMRLSHPGVGVSQFIGQAVAIPTDVQAKSSNNTQLGNFRFVIRVVTNPRKWTRKREKIIVT